MLEATLNKRHLFFFVQVSAGKFELPGDRCKEVAGRKEERVTAWQGSDSRLSPCTSRPGSSTIRRCGDRQQGTDLSKTQAPRGLPMSGEFSFPGFQCHLWVVSSEPDLVCAPCTGGRMQ